jgi:hypothetical protein
MIAGRRQDDLTFNFSRHVTFCMRYYQAPDPCYEASPRKPVPKFPVQVLAPAGCDFPAPLVRFKSDSSLRGFSLSPTPQTILDVGFAPGLPVRAKTPALANFEMLIFPARRIWEHVEAALSARRKERRSGPHMAPR